MASDNITPNQMNLLFHISATNRAREQGEKPMVAWKLLEPPDPTPIPRRRLYKIARCEVCGVVMQPDEIAYSGPRFCVDCACEHEENMREAERMEREGSK